MEHARAGVLLLHERAAPAAREARDRLESADLVVRAHELSPGALASDRAALAELGAVLDELARRPEVDRERLAVVGLGRGGTLAFLLGCTRRLAAVVDVDGPVLHPELSPARPIQPLELALNLEGSFLGLFSGRSSGSGAPVGPEEIELLRERLSSAARTFDIVVDLHGEELWSCVLSFLSRTLLDEGH